MKVIREILPEEAQAQNKVARHITQGYEWGAFKERTGEKVYRLGIFQERNLLKSFQLTFHRLPKTDYSTGYLPRTDFPDKIILKSLVNLCRKNRAIFLKIEPWSAPDPKGLAESGFKSQTKNVLPTSTFLIYLTKTEEELLAAMHEKTRYNIKLAQKHAVTVKLSQSDQDLERFIELQHQTAKRNNFEVQPPYYFKQMWRFFKPLNAVFLLSAFEPGGQKIIASILLTKFKDILYYPYPSGMDFEYRNLMPNHLLHWEAIQLGKKLGCTIYDFWAALPLPADPKNPWYGFHRFKEGFGGEHVSYPGAYELVFNPTMCKLYTFAETTKFKLSRLKKNLEKIV